VYFSDEALRDISRGADCVTGLPGGQCDCPANIRAFSITVALFSSKARLPGVSRTWQNFAVPRRR